MRDPDALVFDLYGTLLEIASVGRAAAAVTEDRGTRPGPGLSAFPWPG